MRENKYCLKLKEGKRGLGKLNSGREEKIEFLN